MATYTVSGTVTISCYTIVEADSPEEAKAIAYGRGMCAVDQPERHGDSPDEVWVHSGELDGTPEITDVEPA